MKRSFNLIQISMLSFFFSLLMIASCSKEHSQSGTDQEEENASLVSSESDGEAEMVFDNAFDDAMGVSDDVGMAGTGIFGRNAVSNQTGGLEMRPNICATVTITHPNSTPFPVHVVIDFGTAGCTGPDGHLRRGKIIIDYTNRLIIPGAVAETHFEGFYIDSIHVEGLHRIENTGSVTPLTRKFKIDVTNGKLTRPNGDYTEWNSHKVIEQIEGLATPDFPQDDAFKITGTASGHVRRGNLLVAWESNIREPLIKRFNCRWIVRGIIRTVRGSNTSNPWVAELDFGPGNTVACDNVAQITINGHSHIITLH
jgi:hypothetical protein